MLIPLLKVKDRGAIIVGGRHPILHAAAGQHRRITAGIGRYVRDVGVFKGQVVLVCQCLRFVQGSIQGFERSITCQQIAVLGGQGHAVRANQVQHFFLLCGWTRFEQLLKIPGAVHRKPEIRIPPDQVRGLGQHTRLCLGDLALVVGKAYVKVRVRHHKYGPLTLRR